MCIFFFALLFVLLNVLFFLCFQKLFFLISDGRKCYHWRAGWAITRDLKWESPTDQSNNQQNEKSFIFSICGKMLKAKSGHRCHEMGHSDSDQNKWECQICSKTFVDKGHFLGHVNKNIGKKPFKCPKCKQQYTYKASFRRHVQMCSNPTANSFKCQNMLGNAISEGNNILVCFYQSFKCLNYSHSSKTILLEDDQLFL